MVPMKRAGKAEVADLVDSCLEPSRLHPAAEVISPSTVE
jgi:hypothetical protein